MEFNAGPFISLGLQGLFYILLLFFTLHTVFLSYHWFKYGGNKSTALIALGLYLAGGALLLLAFSVGLNTL